MIGLARPRTAVIVPEGLIGRVVDVRPGSSVIQVLTDPASTVGAHLVRTRTQGIVEGDARGTLRFKYLSREGADVQVGDVVVTSGVGGLFPRGIPIGRVRAVDKRGSALFSFAQLAPAVLLAVFYPRLPARAVIAGIAAGTVLWGYVLFAPQLLGPAWVQPGPLGMGWLSPDGLFGLAGVQQ